jgi:CheY-like chemotaxis protein
MKRKKENPRFRQQDKDIILMKYLNTKGKILVADDDAGIRDVFRIILEKAGYQVELKENGRDLLEDKFSLPDIFLIDKLLSGLDGLDICTHLKSLKKTRNVPVIMISASPNIGRLAKKAGADDFLEKPFDMNHLLKMVERYINPLQQIVTP